MNFPLFIGQRLYLGSDEKRVSRPAIIIAKLGITIGLAVIILTVAVVGGFKREVQQKIVGFVSHIQISSIETVSSYESLPVQVTDSMLTALCSRAEVRYAQRFSLKAGMVKTDSAFQGMMLKGVGQEYDMAYLGKCLIEGELPHFTDTASTRQVLVSATMASKLRLKVGDKLEAYFMQKNVLARKMLVTGIYQTNFSDFDNLFLLTDIYTVNRLNKWESDQVTGIELLLNDGVNLEDATLQLSDEIASRTDDYGANYCVQNIEQLNPSFFAWLSALDVNVWVVLVLMMGVAGFTIISGLLIVIIERTQMIGLLKAVGATDTSLRKVFLYFSVFLIGRGMLWGNVVGLSCYFIQRYTRLLRLDPDTYYMDAVPMSFSFWVWLALNVGTLLVSVLMLVGPTYIISRIRPTSSMRFE